MHHRLPDFGLEPGGGGLHPGRDEGVCIQWWVEGSLHPEGGPPARTGKAGGTQPTGMLSCFERCFMQTSTCIYFEM